MSKIVIDARMWAEGGIGRYLRNLIGELQVIDHENEYYILLLKKDFSNKVIKSSASGSSSNFHKVLADFRWYTIKEQFELPRILQKINPDLVHFPHFNVPIFYRGKYIVTIHDLIHQHFSFKRATLHNPITHRLKLFGYNQVFRTAIHDSIQILSPSQFVKKQLINEWGIEDKKIEVTPEGVDDDVIRLANRKSEKFEKVILNKLGVVKPYIFYIGNAHPHKNVETLIKAFKKIKESSVISSQSSDNGNKGLTLVLSGQDNYFWKRIRQEFKDMDGIVFTGFVSEEEMVVLYKNSEAYVTTSFEEGFGIPILEAMASGTPVVCSDAGSLKEVGGTAALYFDPKNVEDVAEKIKQVLTDSKLRDSLIKKGEKRVKEFSWKKMAEETLEVYKSV